MTSGEWVIQDVQTHQSNTACYIVPAAGVTGYRGDICRLQSAEHIGGIDAAEMAQSWNM